MFLKNVFFMFFFIIGYKTRFSVFHSHIGVFYNYVPIGIEGLRYDTTVQTVIKVASFRGNSGINNTKKSALRRRIINP